MSWWDGPQIRPHLNRITRRHLDVDANANAIMILPTAYISIYIFCGIYRYNQIYTNSNPDFDIRLRNTNWA